MTRATYWLLGVACVAAVAMPLFADFVLLARRVHEHRFVLELVGTLLTGVAGVVAAFNLSLHDRSRAWALLPVPPLLLWLSSSGYACYRDWIELGTQGWALGESADCLFTIVGFSIPMGVSLLIVLARARPISPAPVATIGGLGVAGIAAFLLDFNHPIDASFLDLGWHAGAVGIVVLMSSIAARFRVGLAE